MTRPADVPHKTGLLQALRMIRGGHVILSGSDAFSDGGRPFPGVLTPFLHELFAHGQVRLEEQQGREPPRAVLTTAGEELLAELEEETDRPTSDES